MKSCSYKKNKLRQSDYFTWNLPSFLKFDFLGLILYLHYLFLVLLFEKSSFILSLNASESFAFNFLSHLHYIGTFWNCLIDARIR